MGLATWQQCWKNEGGLFFFLSAFNPPRRVIDAAAHTDMFDYPTTISSPKYMIAAWYSTASPLGLMAPNHGGPNFAGDDG